MAKCKQPAFLWLAAAGVCCCLTLLTVLYALHSSPVMRVDTDAIAQTAQQALDCIVSGDYDTLESFLYGSPDLGEPPAVSDTAEGILWEAYAKSLHFRLEDTVQVEGIHPEITVHAQYLDIPSAADSLQAIAEALAEEKAAAATSEEGIYDSEHNYLPEFVSQLLKEAAAQALESSQTQETELLLEFADTDEGWKIRLTEPLVQLLSGFPER